MRDDPVETMSAAEMVGGSLRQAWGSSADNVVVTKAVLIYETMSEAGRGLGWLASDEAAMWDVFGMMSAAEMDMRRGWDQDG